jgi:ketosteroid isomerase-like protein
MTDAERAADVLHRAIAGDGLDDLASLYADDAVIWHNSDRVEMTKAESIASIGGLGRIAKDVHAEVVRFIETPTGFVEMFIIKGTVAATGNPLALHNCLVVTLRDGQIARLDEYVDPTGAAQFS